MTNEYKMPSLEETPETYYHKNTVVFLSYYMDIGLYETAYILRSKALSNRFKELYLK